MDFINQNPYLVGGFILGALVGKASGFDISTSILLGTGTAGGGYYYQSKMNRTEPPPAQLPEQPLPDTNFSQPTPAQVEIMEPAPGRAESFPRISFPLPDSKYFQQTPGTGKAMPNWMGITVMR